MLVRKGRVLPTIKRGAEYLELIGKRLRIVELDTWNRGEQNKAIYDGIGVR